MENTTGSPTPAEARAALDQAGADASAFAGRVVLPPAFLASIGGAVAVQIGTTALGVAIASPVAIAALVAGFVLFLVVAVVQLVAFRRRNGVWLGGLLSRVVGGTATTASLTYAAALAAATWAAFSGLWWLVPVCAVAGGVGYVLSGRRWLRAYRSDPVAHGRGESAAYVAVLGVLLVAGLVLLLANR